MGSNAYRDHKQSIHNEAGTQTINNIDAKFELKYYVCYKNYHVHH